MSERTPKLNTIRHAWVKAHPFPLTTDVEERYAEFDRALAARDAEVRAAALAEQGEPTAAREFLEAALAESDADEAEGGAGWDVEVDARTVLELLDELPEPRGEPTDAQVRAVWDALGPGITVAFEYEELRTALRAASAVQGGENRG